MNARLDRATRAAVVVAVLLGLLAVVALTSSRNRPKVSAGSDPGAVTEVRDIFLTVAGTLYAAGIVAAAVLLWKTRGGGKGSGTRLSVTSFLAFVILAIGLTWFARSHLQLNRFGGTQFAFPSTAPQVEPSSAKPRPKPLPPAEFRWDVAAGLLAVMAAVAAAAVIVQRRQDTEELGPLSAQELAAAELADIVAGTIDDLRREEDPRRAVIAAYAQMENALERHGLPRDRSEAPFEYLTRMLRELRVRAASALALTELFERARFSDHVIDAAMKDEAIDALVAVRNDLRPA